jgi:hypothetical protein
VPYSAGVTWAVVNTAGPLNGSASYVPTVLIIVIYAIVKVLGSSAGTGAKVLWVLLILVLPVIGVILWLLLGPKG